MLLVLSASKPEPNAQNGYRAAYPDDPFTLSDGTGPLHAETVGHGTRPVPAIIAARPGGRSNVGGMSRSQLSCQQLRGALVGRASATGAYLERHRAAGRVAWAARRGAQVDPGREHLSGVVVPKAPERTVPAHRGTDPPESVGHGTGGHGRYRTNRWRRRSRRPGATRPACGTTRRIRPAG